MRFHIPIKLPSLANLSHLHWYKLSNITKKQKKATKRSLRGLVIPPLPLLITITRIGPHKLDDDNVASACKYIRDEIARAVNVDDGSPLYTWRCEQRTGKYGVDVEITER